jgi:hypothetical protein
MTSNFKPLMPGLTTAVPADVSASTVTNPSIAPIVSPPHEHSAPAVSFKRDGDKITRIVVTCRCGETIELTCVY